jgi:Protein of unknown function (DUF3152)
MSRTGRFLLILSALTGSVGGWVSLGNAAEPERLDLPIHVESKVKDVSSKDLGDFVLATLNDPRSWVQANVHFTLDTSAKYRVVLTEPKEVDALCKPLGTAGKFSCQNGPVVALNADKWRNAFSGWDGGVETYRQYMVNHEVGHLFGQRHPKPSCPKAGGRAAVMEQQSKGLNGCKGNAWPLSWEIEYARQRPLKIAPLPDWAPDPVPVNQGDLGETVTIATTAVDGSTSVAPNAEAIGSEVVTSAADVVPTSERPLSELGSNIDAAADTEAPINENTVDSGPNILVLALGAFGVAAAIAAVVSLLGRRSRKLKLVERKTAALLESTRKNATPTKVITPQTSKSTKSVAGIPEVPVGTRRDTVSSKVPTAPAPTAEPTETQTPEAAEAPTTDPSEEPTNGLQSEAESEPIGSDRDSSSPSDPIIAAKHNASEATQSSTLSVHAFGSRAMSAIDEVSGRSLAVVVVPAKDCTLSIDELLTQARALLVVAVDLLGEGEHARDAAKGNQLASAAKATCDLHRISAGILFVTDQTVGYLSIGRVAIGTANKEGSEPVISSKGQWKTEGRVDDQLVLFGGAARPIIERLWPIGELTAPRVEALHAEADRGHSHPFVVITVGT